MSNVQQLHFELTWIKQSRLRYWWKVKVKKKYQTFWTESSLLNGKFKRTNTQNEWKVTVIIFGTWNTHITYWKIKFYSDLHEDPLSVYEHVYLTFKRQLLFVRTNYLNISLDIRKGSNTEHRATVMYVYPSIASSRLADC